MADELNISDWSTAKIHELATENGFCDGDWIESKDQSPEGTVRLLQVGNVLQGRLRTDGNFRWVTQQTVERLRCTLLSAGDILIARMPDPVGRACIVPSLPYKAITAVDCAILRTNPSCERDFVVQVLNWSEHLKKVNSLISGTTRQRISRGNLGQISIPLPPLPEQRKIAAILSSVDDAIEKSSAVIDQLKVVKKALMQELLTRGLPGRHTRFNHLRHPDGNESLLPNDWKLTTLGDVAEVVGGGTPSKTNEHLWNGDVLWATPSEITKIPGRRISNTERKISAQGLAQSSAKLIPAGSILMTSRATIGACAINTVPMTTNQGFQNIIPSAKINADFLLYFIQNSRRNLERLGSGSTFLEISKSIVKSFPIPLPHLSEQLEIAKVLSSNDDAIEQSEILLNQLRKTKFILTSKLLSGEVRVPLEKDTA